MHGNKFSKILIFRPTEIYNTSKESSEKLSFKSQEQKGQECSFRNDLIPLFKEDFGWLAAILREKQTSKLVSKPTLFADLSFQSFRSYSHSISG